MTGFLRERMAPNRCRRRRKARAFSVPPAFPAGGKWLGAASLFDTKNDALRASAVEGEGSGSGMHCEQKVAKKSRVGQGKGEGQNVQPPGHGPEADFEGVYFTPVFARKSASLAPCLSGYYVKPELLRNTAKVGKPHF